jgi:hypothetical protein
VDAQTLNQLGLAAQFVAFWFVTPEVVAPTTLERGSVTLRTGAHWIGRQAGRLLTSWALGIVGIAGITALIALKIGPLARSEAFPYFYSAVFLVVILAILVGLTGLLFYVVSRFLEVTERWRRRFAVSGALLFVAGTAAQLAATF